MTSPPKQKDFVFTQKQKRDIFNQLELRFWPYMISIFIDRARIVCGIKISELKIYHVWRDHFCMNVGEILEKY